MPIALGAAGAAGLVVGVASALSSQSAKDDAESLRRSSPGLCAAPGSVACASYDASRDSAESSATVAWVGYVGGAVLVAAGVAAYVLWPKTRAATVARSGLVIRW